MGEFQLFLDRLFRRLWFRRLNWNSPNRRFRWLKTRNAPHFFKSENGHNNLHSTYTWDNWPGCWCRCLFQHWDVSCVTCIIYLSTLKLTKLILNNFVFLKEIFIRRHFLARPVCHIVVLEGWNKHLLQHPLWRWLLKALWFTVGRCCRENLESVCVWFFSIWINTGQGSNLHFFCLKCCLALGLFI